MSSVPPAPHPSTNIYLTTQHSIDSYAFGRIERPIAHQLIGLKDGQCPPDPFTPCMRLELPAQDIETNLMQVDEDLDLIDAYASLPHEPSPFHPTPPCHLSETSWFVSYLNLNCDAVALHARNEQTGRLAFIFFHATDIRTERHQPQSTLSDQPKEPKLSFNLKPLCATQTGIDLIKVDIVTDPDYPRISVENVANQQVCSRVNTRKTFRQAIGIYPNITSCYDDHITLTKYTPV